MKTQREIIEEQIYNRAYQYHNDNRSLSYIVEHEPDMKEWSIELVNVAYADQASYAVVPYEDYMIMAHDLWDDKNHCRIAEYGIYRQHDRDGHPLMNSLNYNATYEFIKVSNRTYPNMAVAISAAVEELSDVDDMLSTLVGDMTDGDPEAELSDADIRRLVDEAKAGEYEYAEYLTPELFRTIYERLKGDD